MMTAFLVLIYIGIVAYTVTGILSAYEKLIVIKKLKEVTKDIHKKVKVK
ncbi:hypothetical protein M2M59_03970 [Rummeliibacillus sp. G93]|nr:hypothetical protein [Rummeliibacillus sp. G93]UQW98174.1 hypothetical protein M2M59_03970 [Rummeliibacillus sp. G93]